MFEKPGKPGGVGGEYKIIFFSGNNAGSGNPRYPQAAAEIEI